DTLGTSEVPAERMARIIRDVFPLKPAEIIEYLDLRRPIYFETARHGHFGREGAGFSWERTDRVRELRSAAQVLQAV
ncbi:MAG: methionine adenosyltransferase domain-containing protein, partial [Planctomycetes bacterium]|nr:methionine adenosyltransferase domain-containing protein [Planctomycetota bacterium]